MKLTNEQQLKEMASRLTESYGDNCPFCGKVAKDAKVVGETGWYVRTVIYKCACNAYYKITI